MNEGMTVFFTGLSGSGKSTLSELLFEQLSEYRKDLVTLLDGDKIRQDNFKQLGYSRQDRVLNITRVADMAKDITKNKQVAICALISPYQDIRQIVREKIEEHGIFVEVYVSTPLSVCEKRDKKGLYAKARQGSIKDFTGISAPYEEPLNYDIKIDTSNLSPEECVKKITLYLIEKGYIN